jgi:hypothetical protein
MRLVIPVATVCVLAATAGACPIYDRWTSDAELGWLFRGEYACYSLRNREHLLGTEGRFPFAHIQNLFGDVKD